MNTKVLLCRYLAAHPSGSQRKLAQAVEVSLGKVNSQLKELINEGFVQHKNTNYDITSAGLKWLEQYKVDNAIILAAGFGSRFVPITYETPKGLLKVKGQPMIERQIEQLHEVGIKEIFVVVGYLAEMFEYLKDKYGIKLIYNPEYATKNNYASLYCAKEHLRGSYVLVADHWIENNIFNKYEPSAHLSCTYNTEQCDEWRAVVGAHDLITHIDKDGGKDGWFLMGPGYFSREFSAKFLPLLEDYIGRSGTQNCYWEDIVRDNIRDLPVYINRQSSTNIYEFECMDDLVAYDPDYLKHTDSSVLTKIAEVFGVSKEAIVGTRPMVEGMTNQSFVFEIDGARYVYRQPGAGTERLINRRNEKRAYELVAPLNIADETIYFDGPTGIKITKHYSARMGDAQNDVELKVMMEHLRIIHDANIQTDFHFDVEERANFYEKLAMERNSILFEDFAKVRAHADELFALRKALAVPERLCHIDYIHANILFLPECKGIRIIDWEYAGMADPIIDVAMFAIYAYFDKERADKALLFYLGRKASRQEEARLYMYIALAGFVWSIWTEYKQGLGDDFGDYALKMYRYMKDYYHLLKTNGYLDEFGGA